MHDSLNVDLIQKFFYKKTEVVNCIFGRIFCLPCKCVHHASKTSANGHLRGNWFRVWEREERTKGERKRGEKGERGQTGKEDREQRVE